MAIPAVFADQHRIIVTGTKTGSVAFSMVIDTKPNGHEPNTVFADSVRPIWGTGNKASRVIVTRKVGERLPKITPDMGDAVFTDLTIEVYGMDGAEQAPIWGYRLENVDNSPWEPPGQGEDGEAEPFERLEFRSTQRTELTDLSGGNRTVPE
ncbi:MAG: hypothetical protein MJA29_00135 [Candidatus Omnitrophica bacterium]|nr:hypothetical protein [Candidatus Omnitrophota bacterium]